MKNSMRRLLPLLVLPVLMLAAGCDGSAECPTTFLGVLNTILLGITAAGSLVIIREI